MSEEPKETAANDPAAGASEQGNNGTTAAAGLTNDPAAGSTDAGTQGDGTTEQGGATKTEEPGGDNADGATNGSKPKTAAAGLLGDGDKPGEGTTAGANFTDEQYTEGFKGLDEDVRNACGTFTKEFREAGLSPEAAAKLATAWAKRERENFEKFEDETADRAKELLQTWTAQERTDAGAAIKHFIKPDSYLDKVIKNSPVGNDPDFLNLLKTAGATMRSDNAAGAGAKGAAGVTTPLSKQLGIDF